VDRNSARRDRATQYTSSAAETPQSSFGVARRPSSTLGRCSGHLEPASLALKGGSLQLTISPLRHPVGLWMVGGGLHMLYSQQLGEAHPKGKR